MTSDSKRQRDDRARQATPRTQPARRAPQRRHGGPLGLDSEQSAKLLLFGGTAVVLIAAAVFLAVGYYVGVIQPRGRTVLEVEGIEISYSAMKRRLEHEYYTNPTYQDPQVVDFLPQLGYGNLLEELTLVTKGEASFGLTIDAAKIEEQERLEVGVGPQADEAAFASAYRQALSDSRLTDSEFRRKIRAAAIEKAIRDKMTAEIPATVEQAKVEVITTAELETAQQAIDRVRAGEPWATVAAELSTEGNAAETGGVKDYLFNGRLPVAYNDYAFSAPIGEISEPLQESAGVGQYFVVRVVDRSQQPVTDGQKTPYVDVQYEKWLEDTQATMTIVDNWTDDAQAQFDAYVDLRDDSVKKARERLEQQNQPLPTVDPGIAATAAANNTAAAGTQVASGTPVAATGTPVSGQPTPAATADGQ
jgi:hypothetical protein